MAARAVCEGVRAIAAPSVADRILKRALHLAGETQVPEGGARLQRFVERHLVEATTFVLGADAAEMMAETLGHVVARIPSIAPDGPPSRAAEELARAAGEVSVPGTPEMSDDLQRFARDFEAEDTGLRLRRTPRESVPEPALTLDDDGLFSDTPSAAPDSLEDVFSLDDPAAEFESFGSAASREALRESTELPTAKRRSLEEGRPQKASVADHFRRTNSPKAHHPTDAVVVLATKSEMRTLELGRALQGRAKVVGVDDVVGLVDTISLHEGKDPLVVLDAVHPAVAPTTLTVVLATDETKTRVLVWGAATDQPAPVLGGACHEWRTVDLEATGSDVLIYLDALEWL